MAATRSGRPDVLRRAAAGAVAGGRYRWGQRTDPVVLAELARDAEALAVVAAHGGLADVLVANPQSVTVQILDALEDPDGALAAVVAAVLPPTGESDSDSASHLFKGAPELAARAVRFVPTSQLDRLRTFGVDIDSLMVRAAAAELVGKPSAQAMFWGPEGDWGGTLGDLLEASLHLAASGAGSVAAVSP